MSGSAQPPGALLKARGDLPKHGDHLVHRAGTVAPQLDASTGEDGEDQSRVRAVDERHRVDGSLGGDVVAPTALEVLVVHVSHGRLPYVRVTQPLPGHATITIDLVLEDEESGKVGMTIGSKPLIPLHDIARLLELAADEIRAGRINSFKMHSPEG